MTKVHIHDCRIALAAEEEQENERKEIKKNV